jgi:SSS family solute:Na+ symporter
LPDNVSEAHQAAQVVVLAYMALMVAIGVYFFRHMKTIGDYFKGGSSIPGWAAGISAYMTNFSAYTFVAIASRVYISAPAGIMLETGPALAFYIGALVLATRWHRAQVTTPVEYLEARYGTGTRQLFAWLGLLLSLIGSGMRIYALSKLVSSMLGFPLIPSIIGSGAIMLTYTLLGGVWAVVVTDVVQFVVLFSAVIPLFFVSLARVGWISGLFAHAPEGYFSFPSGEYTWYWLGAWWLSYMLDYNGNWGIIQRYCVTSSEREARKAGYWAAALSVPHAVLLLTPLVVARVMMPGIDPEAAYGKIALTLLPTGMIGVVAAAMLAATMSALDSSWNINSGVLTKDIYQRLFRPEAGDRELLNVGRLATAFVGVSATSIAVTIAVTETELFKLAEKVVSTVQAPTVVPVLLGLLIPRMPRWSALVGLAVGALAGWINHQSLPAETPFAVQFALSFGSVIGVMLLCAWLAPARGKDRERIAAFFEKLRTPAIRPSIPATDVPNPLRIIGVFVALIGVMMLGMTALPQSSVERLLTALGALFLVGIGVVMRWFGGRDARSSRQLED